MPRTAGLTTSATAAAAAAASGAAAGTPVEKPMMRYQAKLPRLPVPELAHTTALYLKSVEPLLTPTQLANTRNIVADFAKAGGLGEELTRRLRERAKAAPRSWLIEWWNELAYFGYRDSVVINVSYFFLFKDDPRFPTQTGRAASLVQASLKFRDLILRGELPVDMAKDTPLDMSQFEYMFNASRRALPKSDKCVLYPPEKNQHITVLRKNRIFSVPVFPQGGSKPYSTAQIDQYHPARMPACSLLQRVVQLAGDKPDPRPIGLLTTENRDVYAEALQQLLEITPANTKTLEHIEGSILTVCLDDTAPLSRNDACRALWHGDGRNRFFDKSIQLIVFSNGKAGFNGEHSSMDGMPTSRFSEFLCDSLAKGQIDHGSSAAPVAGLPEPAPLTFQLNATIEKALTKAAQRFDEDVRRHDHYALYYNGYGKGLIKQFKMSPDAFAQMAIQLAYFRLKGTVRATYESAQTRKFLAGRTEVCRTCTTESTDWVHAMENPKATNGERLEKLRRAVAAHTAYMSKAVDAQGCDRHILGMKLARKAGETHPFFDDIALKESTHWYISTSQLSCEHFEGYGWGEVEPDGFGIAYMINENVINFNVANLRTWARSKDMADLLEKSLVDMRKLCEATSSAKL